MEGPSEVDAELSLYRAIHCGQVELIKSLVQTGADPNVELKFDKHDLLCDPTPLMLACSLNRLQCVNALLEAGANPEICDRESGDSPLVMCVRLGHLKCARALLMRGADVNAASTEGWPALLHASREGGVEMVNLLVAANADVEQRTPGDANTALNAAAMWGRHACVQALVEAGAKVNATNRHKDTALMLCATECMHNESSDSVKCVSVKCVETLLKAGAFVDLRDSVGNTALMKAVERYRRYSWDSGRQDLKANETIIKLLIDAGASLKNKSELGGYNIEGSPLYELPWMFTRRMAYLWRVFRDGVRARGVVMYWYGEMLKRQHAPGGNGRRRDRDEFVEDCVALL